MSKIQILKTSLALLTGIISLNTFSTTVKDCNNRYLKELAKCNTEAVLGSIVCGNNLNCVKQFVSDHMKKCTSFENIRREECLKTAH